MPASGQSVAAPLPAKDCFNFLQQRSKQRSLTEFPGAMLHSFGFPEEANQLLTSHGPPDAYSMRCTSFDDSPFATPTSVRCFDRSVSGFSTDSSTHCDDSASSRSASSWKLEVKNTFVHVADSSDDDMSFTRSRTMPTRATEHSSGCSDLRTSLPLSLSSHASVGSALHGCGSCRPCAWFWKPQGCGNGTECRHCHSCPQDEIKRRRKVNQSTRRNKGRRCAGRM